jgi:hypothetical protein
VAASVGEQPGGRFKNEHDRVGRLESALEIFDKQYKRSLVKGRHGVPYGLSDES